MALDPKKASNALVAVVDLYSAIVAELLTANAAQAVVIQRLGEQIRGGMSGGNPDGHEDEGRESSGAMG
jgi:hypothetical protein